MKNIAVIGASLVLMLVGAVAVKADQTISFTAADVKAAIGSLNDASYQWGLWAVRARPVVTGGGYTITGGSTGQPGWGTTAPSWYSWNTYGTNCAWFWDGSGAEVAGVAANPLYMIMDVAQGSFYSSGFDKNGAWVADWAPGPDGLQGTGDDIGTFYNSGYDAGAGGTNVVTAVSDSSDFSFTFTLDPGATWTGQWEFLVDGSKYNAGTLPSPGSWIENFFGDYGDGGGLSGNMGSGYLVPEPAVLSLTGLAMAALLFWRRRHLK
jgi:hypothetical protein